VGACQEGLRPRISKMTLDPMTDHFKYLRMKLICLFLAFVQQPVVKYLGSDFKLFEDRSHFFDSESISDILDMVIEKVKGV